MINVTLLLPTTKNIKSLRICLIFTTIFLYSVASVFAAPIYTCSVTNKQSTSVPKEFFSIFINTYEIPTDHTTRLQYFQKLKDVGFHTVRFQLNWTIIEKNIPGNYNWSYYDPIFQDLQSAGLQALPTFVRIPVIYRPTTGTFKDQEVLLAENYPAWQNFVKKAVERYSLNTGTVAKIVQKWEIFNEPELSYDGTPENMVQILNAAYDAIKATDPQSKVVAPPISARGLFAVFSTSTATNKEFFIQTVKNGKYDFLNAHIYASLSSSLQYIQQLKDFNKQYGNVVTKNAKLMITETNELLFPCTNFNQSSEEERKSFIVDRFVCMSQSDIDSAYYFKVFDHSDAASATACNVPIKVGILNQDFSIRPAYTGIKNMILALSGNQINKSGDLNGDNLVNDTDVTLLKSKYGNPYTIYDYNKIIANWGK